MLTSLASEFEFELNALDDWLPDFKPPRRVSLCTGVAAYGHLTELCRRLERAVPGLEIHTYQIINHFFGETVTVAGLLTATDVIEQLQGCDLGDELLIPATMLRADEDVFLDDLTPADLSRALGNIPIRACRGDGTELIKALLGIQ